MILDRSTEVKVTDGLSDETIPISKFEDYLKNALQIDLVLSLVNTLTTKLVSSKKATLEDLKPILEALTRLNKLPAHKHKLKELDLSGHDFITQGELKALGYVDSSNASKVIENALKPLRKILADQPEDNEKKFGKLSRDIQDRLSKLAKQSDLDAVSELANKLKDDSNTLLRNFRKAVDSKIDVEALEENIIKKISGELDKTKYQDGESNTANGRYYRIFKRFTQNYDGLVPAPTAADIASNKVLRADGIWTAAGSGSGTVDSIVAGTGITVDNTDPANPIVASSITQYTDADARASISLTTTGTSGAATYDNITGIFNIPQYTGGGGGNVSNTGTPLNNQIAVWTDATTIEGTSGLTYDGSNFLLTGDIGSTGSRITKIWATDLTVTNDIAGSITGNAATVSSANEATDATCFITFITASGTQTLPLKNNTGLTYNSSTNSVGATTFVGALTGNASTATALQNARTIGGVSFDGTGNIVPQTIQIIDAAADTTTFPMLAGSATGSLQPLTDPGLTYNASTNALTATTFIGALTGNADTATTATNIGTATESSDTTCFLVFVTASGTQTLPGKTNTGLTYNSSTNNLGATTFTGALSGNATTATALATPRNIGGVAFDGSAAIVPQTIESANEATDTTCFPLFITASGTQQLQPKNSTSLTYNSNTGAFGATTLGGTLTTAAQTNITSVGTLTGGATGAGFTVALGTSTITGDLAFANLTQAGSASILLGRGSASGAGDYQEITLGSGLTMTNQVLSSSGSSGATTALDNLASVAINAALVLGTSDAFALGSATKQWSDLFLAEGGVIDWDNADVTLTQTGNTLNVAGGTFNVTDNNLILGSAGSATMRAISWVNSGGQRVTLTGAAASGDWTLPAATGGTDTVAGVGTTAIFTNKTFGMGTSGTGATPVAAANVNTTAVGNVGAGTDNLITYTLPNNALSANGKGVRITAWGTTANNVNAKTLVLNFGSAAISTNTMTTSVAGLWRITAEVFRTGSSTQDYNSILLSNGAAGVAVVHSEISTATQTDTASIVIKCTGAATSDNDIVQEGMLVEFIN